MCFFSMKPSRDERFVNSVFVHSAKVVDEHAIPVKHSDIVTTGIVVIFKRLSRNRGSVPFQKCPIHLRYGLEDFEGSSLLIGYGSVREVLPMQGSAVFELENCDISWRIIWR